MQAKTEYDEMINFYNDEWCTNNGYPVYKLSSKIIMGTSPKQKGSSLSPKSTSSMILEPVYKR